MGSWRGDIGLHKRTRVLCDPHAAADEQLDILFALHTTCSCATSVIQQFYLTAIEQINSTADQDGTETQGCKNSKGRRPLYQAQLLKTGGEKRGWSLCKKKERRKKDLEKEREGGGSAVISLSVRPPPPPTISSTTSKTMPSPSSTLPTHPPNPLRCGCFAGTITE